MTEPAKRKAGPLIRAVILLQLKLLLGAMRDLILMPIAMAAALLDWLRLKNHEPHYFRQVMTLGEHSDRWIDVWYANHDHRSPPRENVDSLLISLEEALRDRELGARRARVLKRWAERQIQRAKQRAAGKRI